MPTKTKKKTLSVADRKRALKIGEAVLAIQKKRDLVFRAEMLKERKIKQLVFKIKVQEDGDNYKVVLGGDTYSAEADGCVNDIFARSGKRIIPEPVSEAISKAVTKYTAKKIGLKLKKQCQRWWFKDSDGNGCIYRQSSLADKDTVWFGCDKGPNLHLSEEDNDELSWAVFDIIRGNRKSFSDSDHYGSRYSVKADKGGFVLTIKTVDKKKVTKNNTMRFDARAARMVARIIEGFTEFNDELLGN